MVLPKEKCQIHSGWQRRKVKFTVGVIYKEEGQTLMDRMYKRGKRKVMIFIHSGWYVQRERTTSQWMVSTKEESQIHNGRYLQRKVRLTVDDTDEGRKSNSQRMA